MQVDSESAHSKKPAVVILRAEQLKPHQCQNEECKQLISGGDFALETSTGKHYHYRCYVSAAESEKKYAKQVTEHISPGSRWRGRSCSEAMQLAHHLVCEKHAAQYWRCLWTSGSPRDVQVRFSPWSRPLHGSMCDGFSVRWTAAAAQRTVWPDSAGLNRSQGLALVQHLFPVSWFTEGCAHWHIELTQGNKASKEASCELAHDLQRMLSEHKTLAENMIFDVSCWALDKPGKSLIMRVRWSAVKGSLVMFSPAHVLAKNRLWEQGPIWQQQWQQTFIDGLLSAVPEALKEITNVRTELVHDEEGWTAVGQPQHRAQFTWDPKTAITVWAGLVPSPKDNHVHFVTVGEQLDLYLLRLSPLREPVWLPYHVSSLEDLFLQDMEVDTAQQRATKLLRVDLEKIVVRIKPPQTRQLSTNQ